MILRLKDTKLSVIDGSINGTGSANIPVELVNDDKFRGYATSIHVKYMINTDKEYGKLEIPYDSTSKTFLFPSAVFKYSSSIVIGVMNKSGSTIYNSEPLVLFVPKTPNDGDILDDISTMTWQEYVRNYINELGGFGSSGGVNPSDIATLQEANNYLGTFGFEGVTTVSEAKTYLGI